MKLFTNSIEARFLRRPNRFVVIAEYRGKEITAHCPNPGRLEELLHPNRTLILEHAADAGKKSAQQQRRTEYSLAAAEYKGKIIPLQSVLANKAARELVLPYLFAGSTSIYPEFTVGNSRFDFLIELENQQALVEVKACTLVEHGIAMFPDAPSSRAKRHIEELQQSISPNLTGHIIFMVMHGDAEVFIPNIHTDPEFASALKEGSETLDIHAVSLSCSREGELRVENPELPIDLGPVDLVDRNGGIYIILARLPEDCMLTAGALEAVEYMAGYYVYAGSARKNLIQRVQRHLRKRKKLHWHIDYLLEKADQVKGYPIYSYSDLECTLASDIAALAQSNIPGFGCSDCRCRSHLFYFAADPMKRQNFTDLLFSYRHVYGLAKPEITS